MKKIYSLITIAAASFAVNAQTNLVTNGSFEDWTNATPDGWTISIPANGGTAVESTDAQHLTKSVKVTAPAGTGNVQLKLTDFPVTAGTQYTFSYWYKDESDNARMRHWGIWRDNVNNTEVTITGNNDMKPTGYLANTTGWKQETYTVTAPVGATHMRLDFRTYQETGNSGDVLIDDVRFYDATASTKENDIAGLNIFPNPAHDVLNIASDNQADKNIQLFDMTGKKVLDVTTVSQISVSGLNAGIYVAKITEAGKMATRKVVIR